MLVEGTTEWTEAWFATGVKSNLLLNGINSKLQVSAMTLGPTVVITRYKNTDTSPNSIQCVLDQPDDTVVLHEDATNNENVSLRFRLVAWSQGSRHRSFLAISSLTQVEIWEVIVSSGISATLKGCINIEGVQGLSWNPCNEMLLAYSKTSIVLINALQAVLSWREIYTEKESTHRTWSASSWSPCGLQVSIAQHHTLHCFGWTNVESLVSESPKHDQIDASSLFKGMQPMPLGDVSVGFGPIATLARMSATVCILTMDTKLILEDITRVHDLAAASEIVEFISNDSGAGPSSLVSPINPFCQDVREIGETSSSDIIDLTSIRSSADSTQNPILLLSRVQDTTPRKEAPHVKPRAYVLVVEYKAGRWNISSVLDLPHLTTPDVLFVQETRAIVGSSLSPRLLIIDISGHTEWTAKLSGKLALPPTHVCRGLHLAKECSFVSVASSEKRKRTPFFHAVANLKPLPVYLSTVKVPQRAQFESAVNATANAGDEVSGNLNQTNCNSGENKDLLDLIVVKMLAMQAQLNTRFDDVDKKLLQVMDRVEQLEWNYRAIN